MDLLISISNLFVVPISIYPIIWTIIVTRGYQCCPCYIITWNLLSLSSDSYQWMINCLLTSLHCLCSCHCTGRHRALVTVSRDTHMICPALSRYSSPDERKIYFKEVPFTIMIPNHSEYTKNYLNTNCLYHSISQSIISSIFLRPLFIRIFFNVLYHLLKYMKIIYR